MITPYGIAIQATPALKLKVCHFAFNTIRAKNNDNANAQCFDCTPETAVPASTLYYQRTNIQPGCRRRRFQYNSCTTRDRKSSQPPETAAPVQELHYQRIKNPAGRQRRPLQYYQLYYQRTKIQPAAGDGHSSSIKLYYQRTKIQPAAGGGRSSTKPITKQGSSNKTTGVRRASCRSSACRDHIGIARRPL